MTRAGKSIQCAEITVIKCSDGQAFWYVCIFHGHWTIASFSIGIEFNRWNWKDCWRVWHVLSNNKTNYWFSDHQFNICNVDRPQVFIIRILNSQNYIQHNRKKSNCSLLTTRKQIDRNLFGVHRWERIRFNLRKIITHLRTPRDICISTDEFGWYHLELHTYTHTSILRALFMVHQIDSIELALFEWESSRFSYSNVILFLFRSNCWIRSLGD